jgi:hypothetical protein
MYLTFNPIDVGSLLNEARPSDGGVCVFLGVVRDNNEGKPTVSIQYQAYGPMAESEMAKIARELELRWPQVRDRPPPRGSLRGVPLRDRPDQDPGPDLEEGIPPGWLQRVGRPHEGIG